MTDTGLRLQSLAPEMVGLISASSLLRAGALSWFMAWLEKSMVNCVAVLDRIQLLVSTVLGNKILVGCWSN